MQSATTRGSYLRWRSSTGSFSPFDFDGACLYARIGFAWGLVAQRGRRESWPGKAAMPAPGQLTRKPARWGSVRLHRATPARIERLTPWPRSRAAQTRRDGRRLQRGRPAPPTRLQGPAYSRRPRRPSRRQPGTPRPRAPNDGTRVDAGMRLDNNTGSILAPSPMRAPRPTAVDHPRKAPAQTCAPAPTAAWVRPRHPDRRPPRPRRRQRSPNPPERRPGAGHGARFASPARLGPPARRQRRNR